jgi:glycosyltransferase involved in cell wall biosynthesis
MVSVIIGSYNRYDFLLRAIDSVMNQTYKDIEIIVVDDCSIDDRYENLKNKKDIRFFKTDKNSGLPAVPRNIGIDKAKGDWICFLDDDDYFLPNKIEKQMEYSKEYNFICCDAYCDDNLSERHIKNRYIDIWMYANPDNIDVLTLDLIKKSNLIINSSVLIKKDLLSEIGNIPEDIELRRQEDYHTWMRVLSRNNVCKFIDLPLLYYNIYSEKL